ncbi:MAG TPA: type IV toxin-antitoxin system AbiEi family antitoxin domain-containing protein [Candidatus Aquicultor sp.]|jgi:predicted transcriptional regulator of viral defense system
MAVESQTLGKLGSKLLRGLSTENKTVFSLRDAQELLPDKSGTSVKQLLSRLVRSGWLIRLKRGHYLIVPLEAESPDLWSEDSFVLASASVAGSMAISARAHIASLEESNHNLKLEIQPKEYAVSYWSALNYYGYTEQIPRTVFISTPKRETSTSLELLNIPYRLIFLSPKKFFGVTAVWINNKPVQITDKEKTIVDCFDRPKFCGGIIEAAKGLSEGIKDGVDLKRLTSHAHQIGNSAVFKRLGFLAESLRLPVDPWLIEWQKHISKGYSLLDPTQPKRGRYNAKWHVIVNVEDITTADERVVG